MEDGFLPRIIDRIIVNARLIRGAPEAIAVAAIIAVGVSYFGFAQFHREGVASLNDRIASQQRLIERLTSLLPDAPKSLSVAKSKPVSVDSRSRDPQRLYDDNKPIALVHDPKIDLDKRRVTFPAVNAEVILSVNKSYEFQDWKLACGSTQSYIMVSDSSGRGYSYSPLICKIVGNR